VLTSVSFDPVSIPGRGRTDGPSNGMAAWQKRKIHYEAVRDFYDFYQTASAHHIVHEEFKCCKFHCFQQSKASVVPSFALFIKFSMV
jgi:hypothetical protein